MPVELVGLITQEHFYFLSGLLGILCAFTIGMIWSRGL